MSQPAPNREEVRRRFEAAWNDRPPGSAPPDLESFLGPFDEPERSALRSELEELDRFYRGRSGDVVPAAGPVTHTGGPDETTSAPRPTADGTGDDASAAGAWTVDYVTIPHAGPAEPAGRPPTEPAAGRPWPATRSSASWAVGRWASSTRPGSAA